MHGVERPFGAVSKDGAFKGVCCRAKESRSCTGCPTLRESSSASFRCDRSHPRCFNSNLSTRRKGLLIVVPVENGRDEQSSEKRLRYTRESIAFNDDDLEGIAQPHNNALVVTTRINGFIVKRVLVDQGSGTEVMYPDLFRGLGLKNEDLSKYDTPLVGFDGQMVVLEGQISLLVNMEGKEMMVTFIMVNSFSPYSVILSRQWIHAMGVVSSTLHVKVKFHTKHGIATVRGNKQVARQCLVATVNREIKQKESTEKVPL